MFAFNSRHFVAQLFHCMKKYSLDIPQNIVVYFPQNANDYSLNQLACSRQSSSNWIFQQDKWRHNF